MTMSRLASFELPRLQHLRRCAVATWLREEVLAGPEGWSLALRDPSDMLACFSRLRAALDRRLVAFQYREEHSGHSRVLALPVGAEPGQLPTDSGSEPVLGADALPAMSAIAGDGSLEAFLQASLLSRELSEWGAFGHGCAWLDHHLIDDDVLRGDAASRALDGARLPPLPSNWIWTQGKPDSVSPSVRETNQGIVVECYSWSFTGGRALWRHRDRYQNENSYVSEARDELVAQA